MTDKKISQLSAASTPLAGTEVLPIVQSSTTVKVATDDLTVKNVRSNATSGILQVAGPAAASTRVMTVPDANFTAARTDAGQTFTGVQVMTSPNIVTSINDTNSNEVIGITATASAVNELTVANAATGNAPTISATGSDTNIGITVTPKGTGDLTLSSGNVVIGTSGNGIDFSVTPGTGSSELLDDYEEGTWTPTVTFTGGNGDLSYQGQAGIYTKIGNCVTFSFRIVFTQTTASGYISGIGTLPFTSQNAYYAGGGAYLDNMTNVTGGGQWTITPNDTSIQVYEAGAGSSGVINNTDATNSAIIISGHYYTSTI
jgi:hypothetical protein